MSAKSYVSIENERDRDREVSDVASVDNGVVNIVHHYKFLLKLIVFEVCEQDRMTICPSS